MDAGLPQCLTSRILAAQIRRTIEFTTDKMHHSKFDLLGDISGRLYSFDILFSERADAVRDRDHMRNSAHRTLAREALNHSISVYTRGVADQEPVDEYVAFALAAWPDAKQLRAWRTLCRQRRMSGDQPIRDPVLIAREAMRNLGYSLNWWRWRWAGVY